MIHLHSLKDRSHAAEGAPIWSKRAAPATGTLGRRRPAGEAGGHGPPLQEVLFLARWLAPRAPPPAGA